MQQFELVLLALAAIFDGVLLVVLWEPVNAAKVPSWLKCLIAGLFVAHAAHLLHTLLEQVAGNWSWWLDRVCIVAMSAGLLVLPSAMFHGALRMVRSGTDPRPKVDLRYLWTYLPLMILPWIVMLAYLSASGEFLEVVAPIKWPYVVWLCTANLISTLLVIRARRHFQGTGIRSYLGWLSLALIVMTACAVAYAAMPIRSPWQSSMRMVTILSPLFPAAMFAWYLIHKQLLSLVLERTLVYGAIFLAIVLAHRLLVMPLFDRVQRQLRFDLVLFEFVMIVVVVLAFRPLRRRVAESLRYLLSSNVFQVRDATRQLSVELSRMASLAPDTLVHNFERAVQQAIQVQFVDIDLIAPSISGLENHASEIDGESYTHVVWNVLRESNVAVASLDRPLRSEVAFALQRLQAMWVFRLEFKEVRGVVMLGARLRCDRLAEEQLTALALIFDQFAATLHNRLSEDQRLRAERFAMQQEKLSVLGLMAGSLAHELRNPLSSIRTIASLIHENPHADHSEDVSVIVGEIDRLTETTQRLLDYARPSDPQAKVIYPDVIVQRLLHILGHLAKQYHVQLHTDLTASTVSIAGSDAMLSEVLFNLLRNAIEACRDIPLGEVSITSRSVNDWVILTVSDNGPGIEPTIRESLFQPFVTGKTTGTGLGLYIAAERVRELGGTITCTSRHPSGTVFEVRLSCRQMLTD